MAFNHSKLTVFKIDNAGGTLQDISTYCNMVDFPQELDEVETTTFGATSRTYVPGFADLKIKVGGNWDPTLDTTLAGVYSAFRAGTLTSVSIEYGPAGSTAGYVKKTAEAVMLSYGQKNDIKGVTEWDMELHVTGAVTVTTW
jgi:hypothetical protein